MTDPGAFPPGLVDRTALYLRDFRPVTVEEPDRSLAAVALLLAPDPPAILFIRRATRAGDPWSGQMALPGGRIEPHDEDLRTTAMRETLEEVAIPLDTARFLGALDDVAPRTPVLPPVTVRPFVFSLQEAVSPRPSGEEVAEASWIPIEALVRPGAYRSVTVDVRGTERVFPAYLIEDRTIWGMTERILTPMLRGLGLIP